MNDMQAVREAAERIRALESYHFTGQHPGPDAYVPYDSPYTCDIMDDCRTLSFAYLSITDPTPLTVERLVERGGKKLLISTERCPVFDFGTFRVIAEGDVADWRWSDLGRLNWRINPEPRTVGELAMLLLMMEGR